MLKQLVVFVGVLVASYLLFWGGKPTVDAFLATELSTLLRQAHQFDNRRVTATGTVVRGAAILGVGGYVLRQGEAEILIVTSRGMPELGTQVTVRGTFKQAVALDDLKYAVIIEHK